MSEDKDNLQQAASLETTVEAETQVQSTGETPEAETTSQPKEEKLLAGKFKSAEDMEKSYKELETKLGGNDYSKQLGDKVLEATGYTREQLAQANYSPDDIVKAMISYQDTGKVQAPPQQEMQQKVAQSENVVLNWRLDKRDFFDENPEAKAMKSLLDDFHQLEPNKSPDQLYQEKIKPLMDKVSQTTEESQSVKEKAALNLSNRAVPEGDPTKKAFDVMKQTGHIDDQASWVKERLFGKKK